MNSKKEKIAAVVVTYNRLPLLKECVESLRKQTRKLDEIIVVNNDSTDGTKEWLDDQKDLTVIHQENLGGAGGFHNGMKYAYEKGYDWIWLMDDDGMPFVNALEELQKQINSKTGVLNSLVVSKTDPNKLVFGLEDYTVKKFYKESNEFINLSFLYGANFFNGTLISRHIVSKVGYPNLLFFIYGDELEYYFRVRQSGEKILTIPMSKIMHPEQKHFYIGKRKFFYRINILNFLRVKYVPRNLMGIWFLYKEFSLRLLIKTYIYDLLGLIFWQKNINFVAKYIMSIYSGIGFIKKLKQNKSEFDKI